MSKSPSLSLQTELYPKTRHSLLTRASGGDKGVAEIAINDLARIYLRPVYLAVRARGYRHEDAEDHAQTFLTKFIHSDSFQRFNPEKGRLRCYLAGALSNFLNKAYHKEQRTPPQTELQEWSASDLNSPDLEFDRLCARELLSKAMHQLNLEHSGDEAKKNWFSKMRLLIPFNPKPGLIEQTAEALGKPPGNIRTDTTRLRDRLLELFKTEVRETVRPEDFESELAYLTDLLQNSPGSHVP